MREGEELYKIHAEEIPVRSTVSSAASSQRGGARLLVGSRFPMVLLLLSVLRCPSCLLCLLADIHVMAGGSCFVLSNEYRER